MTAKSGKISASRVLRLTIWTAAHFAVDFGCFLVLFGALKSAYADGGTAELQTVTIGFLIYNVLAFGLQAAIGQLADERPAWRRRTGRGGILLVAVSLLPALIAIGLGITWMAWAAMILAALGNAAFHVGAGRDVLVHSEGRMKENGIFVSSGALGVGLGTMLGGGLTGATLYWTFFAAGCLLSFLSICSGKYHLAGDAEGGTAAFHIAKERSFLPAVGLLLAAIVIRAFAGANIPLAWERTGLLVLLPSAASCLGKAAGGIAGDRFGAGRTGVWSLLVSLPLILFGGSSPVLSLAGILLFNMTMPVTLCVLADLMPKHPGFAFGLTTLALLVGTAVTFFWAVPAHLAKLLLAVLILLAALCIWLTVKYRKEWDHERL